ncbi:MULTISPECIES: SPOR domain-containing protein [Aeromonas]|uniref:SPOR domain-containing protein n=1 Tax=Aeromonas TaxID=642 RepID=UPI000CDBDD6A|nr:MULTISPECIES: SPOR domain-containing protein [Aeromonas]AUY10958.1 cell division protein DamX [Aeromonas sp. ASNIH2]AUZ80524.1 cell division protein DamX [Aeromonas sp. ASNIH1]MDX7686524.1 SPOR domain-containing protein [Aeromonas caviae]MDX7770380.1 SPOR domain-containing protein [Aeromonas caviae]MDX7847208.1 SPOR domain-containing protein [Aeromonas caviae]
MTINKLLKLPSQRQLVDRLLHLIEFNHPFVFLSGKPGSGRGTLCESLLAQLPDAVRVASLIGSPSMKMADVRQLLLQQVVARPLFNAQDALADSFFRMVGDKPARLLLIIERADTLPAELVGELWALCRHNDTLASPHKLAILLSGDDAWCRNQKALLKGRAMPALELEVAPLSAPEQRIFLYEKAKELKIPTALLPKPKVEEILNGAGGHPSAIMQLLEDTMTDRRPKKRQAELPVKKIAIVLALVAGGLLALSYLPLFDSAGQDPAQAPSQGMALPDPVSSDPVNVGAASGALGTQTSSGAAAIPSGNQVARDWQSDAKPLPKKVESETVTTESTNYEGRRVVISDEVVEKLMNQPNVSGALPTAVVDELVGSGSRAVPTGTTAQVKNPAPSRVPARTEAQPASGAQTAPVAAPAAKVALTPVATLNKKPKNHYSIQLMGASNTKAVDSFVAEHGLAGKVWVYKTRFRGSPWYVVVQGDYASSAQAKAAIRKLSPALLKGQPWPKSFAQIQKELKQ